MKKLIVNGAQQLYGEVCIGGAKNAAVAIIPAALLCCVPWALRWKRKAALPW